MKHTKDFTQLIIDSYKSGKSSLLIAKELGFCKYSILRCLKMNNIKRRPLSVAKRKYNFNQDFFKKIDSESKAYFFGLICADGYNDVKNGTVSIGLQETDKDILNKFKNIIGWERELYLLNNNTYSNCQKICKIHLCSPLMSKDLLNLGCDNFKTLKFSWPKNLSEKYYNHFIRGYFDGDGFVSKPETRLPKISIACSKIFAEELRLKIMEKLDINVIIEKSNKSSKISILVINGRNQLLQFLDWVYKDATLFLERKFIRYLGLKNKKLDNRGRRYYNLNLTINKELQKKYELSTI